MEPTTAGITVDTDTLSRRASEMAGRAATQLTDSARQTVTAPLEGLRSWGIGGEWLDNIITFISNLFSNFTTWLSSLFGGSSAPANPPATPDAPPAPPAATPSPTVEAPAPTPQGAPQPTRNRATGR